MITPEFIATLRGKHIGPDVVALLDEVERLWSVLEWIAGPTRCVIDGEWLGDDGNPMGDVASHRRKMMHLASCKRCVARAALEGR